MNTRTHIIELNDYEIRVAREAKIILRSPGVAVVYNNNLLVGKEALTKAYLNPRNTYNRYWYKLNQDALQSTTRQYRHHADLVYAHLLKIHEQAGKPDEVIFTVPGSYSEEQLSMLLGIAEACPFRAVGIIDTAVAAAAAAAVSGDFQYIDIHLHQTVITRLNADKDVSRVSVETVDETGMNKIFTTVVGMIADLFIQQSRFDPLHHAETEQALYDQLPACLQTLHQKKEILLEIQYRNTNHQAKLTRDLLIESLQPVYGKLSGHISGSLPCVTGDRMAVLPGFIDILPECRIINSEAVFDVCRKNEAHIRSPGPELRFVTALPAGFITADLKNTKNAPRPEIKNSRVTHVLTGNDAYPIGNNGMYLSKNGSVSDHEPGDMLCLVTLRNGAAMVTPDPGIEIQVNGKTVTNSTELQPGDIIHTQGSDFKFRLIQVLN